MTAGVYAIVNTVTGDEYIGRSFDIEQRWREHKTALRAGQGNKIFQKAWDTYGADVFTFTVLEGSSSPWPHWDLLNQIDDMEAHYIVERQPAYNWIRPHIRKG
jgi:group I intron endonuclease